MTSLFSTAISDLNIPLYERIRVDIQSRIVNQGWAPDEAIPTEQVLSLEYKVSVGTIRKAIERLVQDGLLYKVQGRGTFIKRPDFKNSLLRFFRFRNEQGLQVVPSSRITSIKRCEASIQINNKLGLPSDTALIQLRRLRVVDGVIVLSEWIWLPEPLFASLLTLKPNEFANLLYPFYYEMCNQFVMSATESLSFATDYEDKELKTKKGDLVVKIERLAQNIEGKNIEYRVSYGQPQHFRYDVRIS